MRTEEELREADDAIYNVLYEDLKPDEPWLEVILRISKMSSMGRDYISGITAALSWALDEEWEFVETPGMIEAFRDYRP